MSSVKLLSQFRPWSKSLCRSESFRILYWFHFETTENKNVLEYSSMWLYQWRNVLIFHKRWWKFGHWHLKYFFWGAGEFEKRWVLNVFIRFRVAQNLVLKWLRYLSIKGPSKHLCTRLNNSPRKQHGEQLCQRTTPIKKTIYMWVHWSFHYCVNLSNKFMRKCAKYAPLIDGIAL